MDWEKIGSHERDAVLGQGQRGDVLVGLVIVPHSLMPGKVEIRDGGDFAVTVFEGGPIATLHPFSMSLQMKSRSGAWQVSTGAGVTVIATYEPADPAKTEPS